jgi:glucose/arabinose dehydrogenase
MRTSIAGLVVVMGLFGCGGFASVSQEATVGPDPQLPPPQKSLIPTVHVAPATGWPAGAQPVAADGLAVTAFATGLEHPRWIYVLPNGDVLVAESAAPPKLQEEPGNKGIKAWFEKKLKKKAGSSVPSANRITLLRDADGDGVPETRTVFVEELHSPFGMALIGEHFYVANADGVVRYPYKTGETRITAAAQKVTDLPAGINHHWTKNLIPTQDGSKLYVTVGSNSNIAENGMELEEGRAAIWEVDLQKNSKRLYATGLRNPVGLAWDRDSGALWTVVNERDELGDELVPDYLTSVQDGAFYGWPYSYYGANIDERVKPQRPDLVAKAIKPDYALGSHVAALGLAASDGNALPKTFAKGMFIGQHGSWNRRPHSGYKVVFVPFDGSKPAGKPIEVLSGFLSADGKAYGRPVGVAIDKRGALLVADDVGNAVWRVTAAR